MSLHNAWTALRHGGNLLAPTALEELPVPGTPPRGLADRLRSALVALEPDKPAAAAFGALLDTVLEEACGLRDGWEKGNALGAAAAEKLLDGTVFKPQRRWTGPDGEVLAVFTTPATRIGVGKGRRPVAQVIEYLRRRGVPLGLLTNGHQWRLVWADRDSLAWVEWDAERWLTADLLSEELTVLRRVLAPASLLRNGADLSPLLAGIRDTRRGQGKLSKDLGENVRRAVETLLRSRQPLIEPAWNDHRGADLYVAACQFVMRLVVTLFAEGRELLPVDNPVYHRAYGLRGLLDQLDRLTPERRRARQVAWPRLLALFRLLHQGSHHPALRMLDYGGDLFRPGDEDGGGVPRALALLESLREPPDDDVIFRVLDRLTRTHQRIREGAGWRTVAVPVDFTELTSEYIGILYEGLLDYELHRAGSEPMLFLNLGDQPALPLDRLEAMDDKTLAALVEKAKVKKKIASGEDAEESDDEAEAEDAPEEDGDAEEEGEDEEPDSPAGTDALELDDARIAARTRAIRWGRRAAEVGKLVKRPRRASADALAAWKSQLDSAAEQLVADVKLPGELYLVRWGGTRKGAGTFYTRPQLTLPTVRRTLEPLLYEEAGDVGRTVRPPEALLSLKVCDPAMGSGSFLVAALRVLTEAVVESLHVHERIQQTNGRTVVQCDPLPEADRSFPSEGFEERLEAVVRRAVVEHCLYGVDIDPLAVELARVALWVETLDRRLPFTFLAHKLRPGNALVGTWLDRFRDYPLLCFDRESPDRKYKGVHHAAEVWHRALKEKRTQAIARQVEILTGQLRLQTATSDEELRAAIDRVRRLYRELRAVPASRPDERARIWRERIQTDAALVKVREAFDTWCALWFWPLDELDTLPLPGELHAPSEEARRAVKALVEWKRFFHWELEFPDVFTEPGSGFDVVVGNPPWETWQVQSLEFFSNIDPLYRTYGKKKGLLIQREIFMCQPAAENDWLFYVGAFKAQVNFARYAGEPFGDRKGPSGGGGDVALARGNASTGLHQTWRDRRSRYRGTSDPKHPFRLQGGGKPYSYRMFMELGLSILKLHSAHIGLVVPSGLYSDYGSRELRANLLDRCHWRWLYGFENRNKIFAIDGRFKFCVVIAEKGARTEAIQAAFMRHDLEDWPGTLGVTEIQVERIRSYSPSLLSILEIRGTRDQNVLDTIYGYSLMLGTSQPEAWRVRYRREFNVTDDFELLQPIDKLTADGFTLNTHGAYSNREDMGMLPVLEGRLVSQFDAMSSSWISGRGRSALWLSPDPEKTNFRPQYLMPACDYRGHDKRFGFPKLAIMEVASATNARTCIAAVTPDWPGIHKTPFLSAGDFSLPLTLALVGVMNSFVFDSVTRLRVTGLSLGWFILEHMPLPAALTSSKIFLPRLVRRMSCGHVAYAPYWLGEWTEAPWRRLWAVTPHERLRLRSMLDAIVAVLYGLGRADFAWILKDCDHPKARLSDKTFARRLDPKGFWRVDKDKDPELRHTVLSLAAFDDLQATISVAGDRDAGIQAFCDQNEGDGWMLPETLCLADLGLTRTIDAGEYDERARDPQPVRSRLGERFLDWQLAQTPEESWAECGRHAKAIQEGLPAPAAIESATRETQLAAPQPRLPGMED